VLIFSTFATRSEGEGNKLKSWQWRKRSRIYFKIKLADSEKIVTFAARFGRNGKLNKISVLK